MTQQVRGVIARAKGQPVSIETVVEEVSGLIESGGARTWGTGMWTAEQHHAALDICDFPLVEQMSLASTEYERGVNEFVKAGLTELKSDLVRPPRVLECPVSFECVVEQIIAVGTSNGGGRDRIIRLTVG